MNEPSEKMGEIIIRTQTTDIFNYKDDQINIAGAAKEITIINMTGETKLEQTVI